MPDTPPVICTLTTKELASRSLQWSDLSPLALSAERTPTGVVSTYPGSLFDRIDELVRQERDCCGTWLECALALDDDRVRLELSTTNPEGHSVILAMAGLDG